MIIYCRKVNKRKKETMRTLQNFQITIYQLLNERNKRSYEFYDFIQKKMKGKKGIHVLKIDRFYWHQLLETVAPITHYTFYSKIKVR